MIKVFLVSLFFAVELFSCGFHPFIPTFSKDGYYNLIVSDIKNPLYYNAYVSSRAYEDRKAYYQRIRDELNIKEWSNYLGISKDEAYKLVYKNGFSSVIKDKQKKKEFIAYKEALKNVKRYDTDWKKVLRSFQKLYQKSTLEFFKTRIAYNIVRAYHHLEEYDKEIEFINSLKKNNSIVWEWIDSYYAGAIKNKGDLVKASYLFSKVFSTHKSDAYIGYYDFEIKSDKQWSELLSLAKSDEEKTLFHFLRSLKNRFSMIKELKYMLMIDKNSIWTKRLLNMVAQRVQYYIFYLKEISSYDDRKLDEYEKTEKRYIEDFLSLLQKYHDDDFTNYLYAYLSFIYQHKTVDVKLPNKLKSLFEYIRYVTDLKKLDEDDLSKRLKSIEKLYKNDKSIVANLRKYTLTTISKLYPKNSIKETFAYYYQRENKDDDYYDFRMAYYEWKVLKKVKKFVKKKHKNYIEKLLVNSTANGYNDNFAKLSLSIFLTQKGKYKKALKLVQELPSCPKDFSDVYDWGEKDRQRASRENPFNINISGDNRAYDYRYFYPQTKFLKTMIKLKEVLKKDPTSDIDNYLYATGLYNISFYGNSPMFYRMYKSCTAMTSGSLETLPEAKKHYLKVLKYSKNKELLAKTYYQLMKIDFVTTMLKLEDNGFSFKEFDEFRYGYGNNFKAFSKPIVQNSPEYKKHYQKLLKYKDTKFYEKIRQCVVFEYFK